MTNHATFPAVSAIGVSGFSQHTATPVPHLTVEQRDRLILRIQTLEMRADCRKWQRFADQKDTESEERFRKVAKRLRWFIAGVRSGAGWMDLIRRVWAEYAQNEIDHHGLADKLRSLGWNTTPAKIYAQLKKDGELNLLDRPAKLKAAV
jgi:hypothetical protein